MKFNSIYNLILEGFSNSYKFDNSNKEKLVFDFYTFQLIENDWKTYHGSEIDSDSSKDIEITVREIEKEMYFGLKKELLDIVYFSIVSEAGHVVDETQEDLPELSTYLKKIMPPKLLSGFKKFYKISDYNNMIEKVTDKNLENKLNNVKIPIIYDGSEDPRIQAYAASRIVGLSEYEFVKMCYLMFQNIEFSAQYAGKPWVNICKAWMNLYEASSTKELALRIDQIYQIQHNSGSVLDKVESYDKESFFSDSNKKTYLLNTDKGPNLMTNLYWLTSILNLRANAKSFNDLIDFCSSPIKDLGYKVSEVLRNHDIYYQQNKPYEPYSKHDLAKMAYETDSQKIKNAFVGKEMLHIYRSEISNIHSSTIECCDNKIPIYRSEISNIHSSTIECCDKKIPKLYYSNRNIVATLFVNIINRLNSYAMKLMNKVVDFTHEIIILITKKFLSRILYEFGSLKRIVKSEPIYKDSTFNSINELIEICKTYSLDINGSFSYEKVYEFAKKFYSYMIIWLEKDLKVNKV